MKTAVLSRGRIAPSWLAHPAAATVAALGLVFSLSACDRREPAPPAPVVTNVPTPAPTTIIVTPPTAGPATGPGASASASVQVQPLPAAPAASQ